jgi:hypothetical protein
MVRVGGQLGSSVAFAIEHVVVTGAIEQDGQLVGTLFVDGVPRTSGTGSESSEDT